MGQLLLALNFMHSNKIFHKDIKPANILVYDKRDLNVCITDLGLSRPSDEEEIEMDKGKGTPGYIAPELFSTGNYTAESDIFSLGVVFFNILKG